MRVSGHPEGRVVGFVDVKVASRVYRLPVQAAPLKQEDGAERTGYRPGFFSEGLDALGILVDSNAPDGEQRETIARASAEAERFISKRLLN
jgi:hypothetical protein